MDTVMEKPFEGEEHLDDVQQSDKPIHSAPDTREGRQKNATGGLGVNQQTQEDEETVTSTAAKLEKSVEESPSLSDTASTWAESEPSETDVDCANVEPKATTVSSPSLSLPTVMESGLSNLASDVDLTQVEPKTSTGSSPSLSVLIDTESPLTVDLTQMEHTIDTASSLSLALPIAKESAMPLSTAGIDIAQVEPKTYIIASQSLSLPIATKTALSPSETDIDGVQVQSKPSTVPKPSLSSPIGTDSTLSPSAADNLAPVEPNTSTESPPSPSLLIASESALSPSEEDIDLVEVEPKSSTVSTQSLSSLIATDSTLSPSAADDMALVEPKASTESRTCSSLPITTQSTLSPLAADDIAQVESKASTESRPCSFLPITTESTLSPSADADMAPVEPKTPTKTSPSSSLPIATESALSTSAADRYLSQQESITSSGSSSTTMSFPLVTELNSSQSVANLVQDQDNFKTSSVSSAPSSQSEDETQPNKQNKNLKAQEKSSTKADGFREKLNLKLEHVEYGSQLRRKLVDLNHDNRLCYHFGLKPNKGYDVRRCRALKNESAIADNHPLWSPRQHSKHFRQHMPSTAESNAAKNIPDHRRKYPKHSHNSDHSRKPWPIGPGHRLGQGQTIGQGQTFGQREMKDTGHHHSRDTHEWKRRSNGRHQTTERTHHSRDTHEGKRRSHGKHQTTERTQKPDISSKRDNTRPINPWLTKSEDSLKKENPLAVLTQLHTFEDGKLRVLMPEEAKEFAAVVRSDEFQQVVKSGELIQEIRDQISPEEWSDGILEVWNQFGILNDVDEQEKRKLVQSQVHKVLDGNAWLGMAKCIDENGQLNFAELMQFGMKLWMPAESPTQTTQQTRDDQGTGEVEKELENTGNSHVSEGEEDEPSEDEAEGEGTVVTVDPDEWLHYANEEVEKGKVCKAVREKGMDTIFCLDMSESMKGAGWDQAVNFIRKFIEGIQRVNLMDRVFEHVALVTFGSETRVQQHLTCNYFEITQKLDHLTPGGTSPMFAGLQMTHAAILGAGDVFRTNGYLIPPRVYLITDGKATPPSLISGRDRCKQGDFQAVQVGILDVVEYIHKQLDISFNPVPVGKFDLKLLKKIANISKGKIVSSDDWETQARSFKNYLKAAKHCGLVRPEFSRLFLSFGDLDSTPEDKMQMEEFLQRYKQAGDSDEEDEDLPPLGSRVQRRLKGATIMEQSKSVLGTVTKHLAGGHLGITWDVPKEDGSDHEQIYYSRGQGHGVVYLVDSPRVLVDEMIAEGCRVRRGIDWRYGDQDGGEGKLGSVYKVRQNGTVKVRWDTGTRQYYRFGRKGIFELEVIGKDVSSWIKDTTQKTEAADLKSSDSEAKRIEEMNKRNMIAIQERLCSEKELVSDSPRYLSPGGSKDTSPAYISGLTPGGADLTDSNSEAKRIEETNKRNMIVIEDMHGSEKLSVPDGSSVTSGGASVMLPGDTSRLYPDGARVMVTGEISGLSPDGASVMSPGDISGLSPDDTSVLSLGVTKGLSQDGAFPPPVSTSPLSPPGTESSVDDGNGFARGTYLNAKPEESITVNNASAIPHTENVVQTEEKHKKLYDIELHNRNTQEQGVDTSESSPSALSDLDIDKTDDYASQIHELAGAKPKTGINKNEQAQWSWLNGDTWHNYPRQENEKIEKSFLKNPKGTAVIKLEGLQFRVVFLRMEQVNTQTKEKQCVQRRTV